jgi:hypothetical protein
LIRMAPQVGLEPTTLRLTALILASAGPFVYRHSVNSKETSLLCSYSHLLRNTLSFWIGRSKKWSKWNATLTHSPLCTHFQIYARYSVFLQRTLDRNKFLRYRGAVLVGNTSWVIAWAPDLRAVTNGVSVVLTAKPVALIPTGTTPSSRLVSMHEAVPSATVGTKNHPVSSPNIQIY